MRRRDLTRCIIIQNLLCAAVQQLSRIYKLDKDWYFRLEVRRVLSIM
jgi:hypothetical protein